MVAWQHLHIATRIVVSYVYTRICKKWYKPCGSEAMASQSSADCCLGKTLPPRFASSALNFITGIFDNLEAFVCLSHPVFVFIALFIQIFDTIYFWIFFCLVSPGEKLCKQSRSNCGEAGSAPGQSYSPELKKTLFSWIWSTTLQYTVYIQKHYKFTSIRGDGVGSYIWNLRLPKEQIGV